jgi:hypothetical protein
VLTLYCQLAGAQLPGRLHHHRPYGSARHGLHELCLHFQGEFRYSESAGQGRELRGTLYCRLVTHGTGPRASHGQAAPARVLMAKQMDIARSDDPDHVYQSIP